MDPYTKRKAYLPLHKRPPPRRAATPGAFLPGPLWLLCAPSFQSFGGLSQFLQTLRAKHDLLDPLPRSNPELSTFDTQMPYAWHGLEPRKCPQPPDSYCPLGAGQPLTRSCESPSRDPVLVTRRWSRQPLRESPCPARVLHTGGVLRTSAGRIKRPHHEVRLGWAFSVLRSCSVTQKEDEGTVVVAGEESRVGSVPHEGLG